MAELLAGKPVIELLDADTRERADTLCARGIQPTLAIVRVGERADDLSYERTILKRADKVGVDIVHYQMPSTTTTSELLAVIDEVNRTSTIHGCLMFRPLPEHIDEASVCDALAPEKDIDGITQASLAGVFTGEWRYEGKRPHFHLRCGYAPSTAQACVEVLDYYNVPVAGAHVVVVGRSLVIGRPVALMLLARDASVSLCHSQTSNLAHHTRAADIVICATGRACGFNPDYFGTHGNQVVLDVGINVDASGKLCGDVDTDAVAPHVRAITPVPGGIGGVTTSVTLHHVVDAAEHAR